MSIKITLIGTGVAIPQPHRVQSGILVELDNPGKPDEPDEPDELDEPVRTVLLFDCGSGVLPRIEDCTAIRHLFLTHLHLDHVADVMSLIKAKWLCKSYDLSIYGPTGTSAWLARLFDAYSYMLGRIAIDVVELSDRDRVAIDGIEGYEIVARATVHALPSLGYGIIDGTGKVRLVYSGDTEPCEGIASISDGADVLIHECSFPDSVPDVTNHTTPLALGRMLDAISVGRVILTHLYPHVVGFEDEMVSVVREHCGGCEVTISCDMETVTID